MWPSVRTLSGRSTCGEMAEGLYLRSSQLCRHFVEGGNSQRKIEALVEEDLELHLLEQEAQVAYLLY